jgi:Terminase large subunit, T4likevirus-type, N-terminal
MLDTHRLAAELRCALDPVTFAVERLRFRPDPWQAKVMRSPAKRLLLNCSRQAGKSTTTAIIGLHQALYYSSALVLLVSPSLRQSRELFGKVQDFLKALDTRPSLDEDNRLSMTLGNGSRVVALPGDGDTTRGFSSPALIVEDEAGYVQDSLYRAIRPMLAVSGGRLILLSTPNGQQGHFFKAWDGVEDWERIEVPATDCPRISPEFLKAELDALGRTWFSQEYECQFVETIDSVFRMDDIKRSITDEVTPLFETPPHDDDVKPLVLA